MRGDWFKDARFGIFIHWGPYSLHGRCVWARYRERMPAAEYEDLARRFDARNYRPDEWVDLALEAGARYMVLCTRQHPGFSLFASEASDFTAPNYGPKRDLVAEYVEACRRRGMRIGFYYSLLDWRFPAYFAGPRKDPKGWAELLDCVRTQIRELCTNYGKIDVLWYDGAWPWKPEDWKSAELDATVRELIHMLVQCTAYGGNLLLDVGPRPDGRFPRAAARRLTGIGRWMKRNSEAVYGNGRCPLNRVEGASLKEDMLLSKQGLTTAKGSTIHLHVFHWPGRRITIGNIKSRVISARMIATDRAVGFRQEGDRLSLQNLPARAPDPYDTVIALDLEGEPEGYPDFRHIP